MVSPVALTSPNTVSSGLKAQACSKTPRFGHTNNTGQLPDPINSYVKRLNSSGQYWRDGECNKSFFMGALLAIAHLRNPQQQAQLVQQVATAPYIHKDLKETAVTTADKITDPQVRADLLKQLSKLPYPYLGAYARSLLSSDSPN